MESASTIDPIGEASVAQSESQFWRENRENDLKCAKKTTSSNKKDLDDTSQKIIEVVKAKTGGIIRS